MSKWINSSQLKFHSLRWHKHSCEKAALLHYSCSTGLHPPASSVRHLFLSTTFKKNWFIWPLSQIWNSDNSVFNIEVSFFSEYFHYYICLDIFIIRGLLETVAHFGKMKVTSSCCDIFTGELTWNCTHIN